VSTSRADISADVGTVFDRTTPPWRRPVVRRRDGAVSTPTNAQAGEAVIGVLPAPSAVTRSVPTSVCATGTTAAVSKSLVSDQYCYTSSFGFC